MIPTKPPHNPNGKTRPTTRRPWQKRYFYSPTTGSACIGCWDVGFIAWAPLPKIPNTLKNKISHKAP